jgi:hypothetical protein
MISTPPIHSWESPRPTWSSTLVGVLRTTRGARKCDRRRVLMSGRPEASVTVLGKILGEACVDDAVAICAAEAIINAAPATARGGPSWGGVAPAGLVPPRPAPPNPYGTGGSGIASPPTAGAAALPLPLPLLLPFLTFHSPPAASLPGVPFAASMVTYRPWRFMDSDTSSE